MMIPAQEMETDDPNWKKPVEYNEQDFCEWDSGHIGTSLDHYSGREDLPVRGEQQGYDGNQQGHHVDINHEALNDDDVMSMKFDSVEGAEVFYNMFAKATGFSVRKGYKFCDDDGLVRYRQWVCSRQGKRDDKHVNREDRKREPRPDTRVDCKATLKIRYAAEENKYVVSDFVRAHTHTLANQASTRFLKSHRKVSDANYAQAHTLRRVGMKTSQIMKLFVLQCGGYENVPFTMKDLYNRMNAGQIEEIADGDAEGAIAYLFAKKDADPNVYFNFTVDNEGRLGRLFWSDSRSREDYKYYGDVLVFYSTYNTNRYSHPLVVMCGINNHFCTSVFACSTVPDEEEDTYEWILNNFLEAMDGKQPASVLTDGAPQMRKAILKCFPNAKHRLCCWHIHRNLISNISNEDFRKGFADCMYTNCSIDQFEAKWAKLVTDCNLQNHEWVKSIYKKREQWALAYLRGNFFRGMRSTERSEKMNDVLKIYLHREQRLFESVRAFDLAMAWLRHEETRLDAEIEHTALLPATEMHYLEKHAAEMYTRRIFIKVRSEMKSQGMYYRYNGMDDGVQCVHLISHAYSDKQWRVQYNRNSEKMQCSCQQMETLGLPCCHMFRVMVIERMKKIPSSCIIRRWTKEARCLSNVACKERSEVSNVNEMARFARLASACNTVCFYATKTTTGYTHMVDLIEKETVNMKKLSLDSKNDVHCTSSQQGHGIGDPIITRGKTDGKKRIKEKQIHNKCSNCGSRDGHNSGHALLNQPMH